MTKEVTAFLIHSRSYKNNSKLLDFLTDDFGLIRLVGRGVKNSKDKLQSFLKLKILFTGNGDLKTLKSWEIIDNPRYLQGNSLFLMMYINELIVKLAPSDKLNLCKDYLYLLNNLTVDKNNNEWQLRLFENEFLIQIGYGIDFEVDNFGGNIKSNLKYSFVENIGFVLDENGIISEQLILVAKKIMPNSQMLQFCKQINRKRIESLLAGRELKSRSLFFK